MSFRQVHAKDGGRIKYQRVCSIDGEEVAYADIAKGYETEDGEMVILTDDDMAAAARRRRRARSRSRSSCPREQIDPMLFEKSYYLEPEKTGAKPYALLRQALLDADRMAVVTVALRQRTTIAVLRVQGRRDRAPDDDVARRGPRRPTSRSRPATSRTPRSRWRTCWSRPWPATSTPSEFEDDYAGAVEALVKAKIEGGEIKRTPTSTKTSGEVVDLLAALQRSVDAAKTARGETGSDDDFEDGAEDEKPAKKTRPRRPPRRSRPPRRPEPPRRRRPRRPPPRRHAKKAS